MDKKVLLFLGVAVLVLVLSVSYFSFKGGDATDVVKKTVSTLNPERGIVCDKIFAEGDAGRSESKMYFYKNKVRYDSTIYHKEAGTKEMHVINDGKNVYVWGSMFEIPGMGEMAMVMPADKEEDSSFMPQDIQDIEYLREHGYQVPGMDCKAWNPDTAMFEPPKDKKFMTEDEMMGAAMGSFANPKAGPNLLNAEASSPKLFAPAKMSCDICKEIPDETAKKQCEEACQK